MSQATAVRAPGLPSLDRLELGSGVVYGKRRAHPGEPGEPGGPARPRQVLERLVLQALERPPCFVGFSGGRDSSAILAEAARLARVHGLPDPIPVTMRFGAAPRTAEDEWQELTVRHLGLEEWVVKNLGDELDALGPTAVETIRRHGPHWPANLHSFRFLLDPASGGALLTGNGGDELFSPWPGHRIARLRRARTRPRRGDLRPLLRYSVPGPLIGEWWLRRGRLGLGWLRRGAAREVARGLAATSMRIERDWQTEVDGYLGGRYLELIEGFSEAMAAAADVRLVQPFLDRRYARAVCADAPREGFPSRTVAMRRYFGDVLPADVPARSGKAVFSEVFFGPAMRGFAAAWNGGGLDPAVVDPETLRREWLKPRPQFCSLVPLQAAWLASQA